MIGGQKRLTLPGAEFCVDALGFLQDLRSGSQPRVGERSLVIGGGRISVEAARSALWSGASEVTVVYPRSKVEMSAHQRDIVEAEREGVQFFMMAQPLRLRKSSQGDDVELQASPEL